jgi:hypothetical protein
MIILQLASTDMAQVRSVLDGCAGEGKIVWGLWAAQFSKTRPIFIRLWQPTALQYILLFFYVPSNKQEVLSDVA